MGWMVNATPRPPPGKTQYPLYRRLGVPEGSSRLVRKISPPLEVDPWTFQPVASHYTWFESPSVSCLPEVKMLIFSPSLWKTRCIIVGIATLLRGRRFYVRVKVKWSRYRPGVVQRVGRGLALLLHDRGTRREWVVSITSRPHFTPGQRPGTHFTGGWVGPRAGLDGRKISSTPGFDPRAVQPIAQSLYRMNYGTQYCILLRVVFRSTRFV